MNSSKTWKSGERARVSGAYRCEACRLDGRDTVRQCAAGAVLPMCDVCPEKDATWVLIRETAASAGA